MEYYQAPVVVADAPAEARAAFIRRTYSHLAGAIFAFIALEIVFFSLGLPERFTSAVFSLPFGWLIVLGSFIGVSYLAEYWANSNTSITTQYWGLGLYVLAEAVIFMPLLYMAVDRSSPDVIPSAALITALLFGGLTYTAFTMKTDFSFLGGILKIGGFVALGVIVGACIWGFTLGLLFSSVMVIFAAGCILYTTSNILHRYNTNQHVAAALSLFAAVALMFWYILRILMRRR
ncbi:MAG: Bax inhibitor-1/YccA family protein [Limisphaerales bacterium]